MNKTIIIMSTQYPGYGGASTNAYALVKHLRKKGFNTIGIFIEDNIYANVDPDNIGNILKFGYGPFVNNDIMKLSEYKKNLNNIINGEPSIILCKNYIAPICSKNLYPNVKNIYLVSGLCDVLQKCIEIPANKVVSKNINLFQSAKDINAINNSDIVVVNSPLTLKLLYNTYSNYKHKIYPYPVDTSKYIHQLIDETDFTLIEKKYDFIITSSILTRKEKNNLFLINILKNPLFNKYTKLIVGKENNKFLDIPNSTVYDLQPHSTLMKLMKESKILLYPSLYDSNPNTVREAIYNNCLVLISNNIGYCENFPEISVCSTYDEQEWTNKCLFLIENYDDLIKNYDIRLDPNDDILQLINNFIS